MGKQATWKGDLALGAVRIAAVRLFTVSESAGAVTFNQAHKCGARTFTRLQTKRWCPTCEAEVANDTIARVFEHGPGRYLEVADADLAACEAPAADTLTILRVLDTPIDPLFIDSTGLLVPHGPTAAAAVDTLRVALARQVAIARLVIRKRLTHAALQAHPRGLAVSFLRTAAQVQTITATVVAGVDVGQPARAHVDGMRSMLASFGRTFEYSDLVDGYSTKVSALLADRVAAQARADLERATKRRRRVSPTTRNAFATR